MTAHEELENQLENMVAKTAEELNVPGVAVGVLKGDEAHYAFHGVTNVEHPLEVDERTLFQFGSTGKTYTATAVMVLVDRGEVDLDAPVRTYVPELRLKDASVAEQVTVRQLLNHTAGWTGDRLDDTGPGDDALARYVELMATFDQITPLGASVSYNNASLSLAGHLVATVVGTTFEQALRDLVLDPLGLEDTFCFPTDIMTRRFAVGHNLNRDGEPAVASPWAMARSATPAGGLTATAADQIAWARFHLGDGTAPDGARVLDAELLAAMQRPTAEMPGAALGDAVGLSWLIKEESGLRFISHGGTTIGQHSTFAMVPDRDFAVVSMSNCGPNGAEFNERIRRWAVDRFLGVTISDPDHVELTEQELEEFLGTYETVATTCLVNPSGGHLQVDIEVKPETLAMLKQTGQEDQAEQPPVPIGMLPGDGDRFIVIDGAGKGMRGYFQRDADGAVSGVHLGGRLATRSG